ncbi:GyrI-like domain-containing protein [Microbulbifer sp. OS29]|uniref:GyrI-like domain-containing protein n=1 Tax=Microbulbifer okhotskensis TaxID=2926617 RepID=A0A9X2EKS8_9GAMM|nr:GyrI-like domain-containing protein [Microbulbifer okhotskensis]MCO1333491.1 GyrI-like domain-containing protein [Microbulbifer okhotskensis]
MAENMGITEIEGFDLVGFCTRTKNANEADSSSAKIAPLWGRFSSEAAPQLRGNPQVYGVYTNYESDHTGFFDVYACSDMLSTDMSEDFKEVQVKPGKYLVFSANGDMPQIAIDLWGEIWSYFSAGDCPHQRAYTTDFEQYIGGNEVQIAISVQ